ncbi:MAG TPA: hypothetical protein DEB39_09955 [Planctomycetaceae bacterium]|nr:hypothetical protein [Planctomycetaceae bacterium]
MDLQEWLHSLLPRLEGLRPWEALCTDGRRPGRHDAPRRQGASHEFVGHREYAPGDDMRRLDWKALGRSDRLLLKRFQDETSRPCEIVLDVGAGMNFRSDKTVLSKFEAAKRTAAVLGYILFQSRDRFRLTVFDGIEKREIVPFDSSPAHWKRFLDRLEECPTAPPRRVAERDGRDETGPGFRGFFPAPRYTTFVLIGDLMFAEPEEVLRLPAMLRTRENRLVIFQLLDPAELEFPYAKMTAFLDMERPGRSIQVDAGRIKTAFCEEMRRFLRQIDAECKSRGIPVLRLRTDEPLDEPLVRFLSRATF